MCITTGLSCEVKSKAAPFYVKSIEEVHESALKSQKQNKANQAITEDLS